VATAELADAGRSVLLVEQEPETSLGGQAFWSFGGLFMVDSPDQRRLRMRDSREAALRDWLAYAEFDRDEDDWARRWAEAYVDFASGEMHAWLHRQGVRWFPLVQWAERRGNSVPRFHITWGTGPAITTPFVRRVRAAISTGRVSLQFRHRVTNLITSAGVRNFAPLWRGHGIRILSGPSPLWLDAHGRRLPPPLFPGADALGALAHITRSGSDHSWFVLDSRVLGREFALSGSEQNPDLTGKSVRMVLARALPNAVKPVEQFGRRGADFVFAGSPRELAAKMNALADDVEIDGAELERTIRDRDEQALAAVPIDAQIGAIRDARRYIGDRLIRVSRPHPMLDPKAGPLVAVRLWILTRKTLGGLQTDLAGRVLRQSGEPLAGLYAAGEIAGFGGGGMHGYRSLEGTFLGGCIFGGRVVGRAAAG
jgi:predicted oxidoreductase